MRIYQLIIGRVLRVTVSVPPSLGYKLSDITIGGSPLKFGGQIAENISMSLSGTAGDGPVSMSPYLFFPSLSSLSSLTSSSLPTFRSTS